MDYEKMKAAAETITMPEEMKRRIAQNCKRQILESQGKSIKNPKNHHIFVKKPAIVFGVLAVVLSLSVTAVAAPDRVKGYFRDVKNWQGAVVGTSYEQATDEIYVHVSVKKNKLTVHTAFLAPDMAPYRYGKNLGISDYKIVDKKGKTVKKGMAEAAQLTNGYADIIISLDDLENGNYTLEVRAFLMEGESPEQPLPLNGNWECVFDK